MKDPRYPGAPGDATISEEGWLIIGDEAWTEAEWRNDQGLAYRRQQREQERPVRTGYFREYRDRNVEKVRKYRREWMRERRADVS
jgi:hypothetical protein